MSNQLEKQAGGNKSLKTFMRITLIIGCVFVVLGLLSLHTYIKTAKMFQNFVVAKGLVISSEVQSQQKRIKTKKGFSHLLKYFPKILYSYQVENREYINDKYNPDVGSRADSSWAADIVSRYPTGEECIVYYNPQNPPNSYLNNETNAWGAFICFAIGLLFITPGIIGFLKISR